MNGVNNRITTGGYTYDANGNMTALPGQALSYDVANRTTQIRPSGGGTEFYTYGSDNHRVWKKRPDGSEEIYLYGALGELLGTYTPSGSHMKPHLLFDLAVKPPPPEKK